jgi:NADH-quinone oxidoreductase subunit A
MLRDYLPILLQIIVAMLFAGGALLVSVIVGKTGRRTRAKDMAYECGMIPQGDGQPRFSVKFYLVAMLFILFDLEIVFMYPWAVVFRDLIAPGAPTAARTILLPGVFWSMLSFVSILMVGYIYALKKGALDFKK